MSSLDRLTNEKEAVLTDSFQKALGGYADYLYERYVDVVDRIVESMENLIKSLYDKDYEVVWGNINYLLTQDVTNYFLVTESRTYERPLVISLALANILVISLDIAVEDVFKDLTSVQNESMQNLLGLLQEELGRLTRESRCPYGFASAIFSIFIGVDDKAQPLSIQDPALHVEGMLMQAFENRLRALKVINYKKYLSCIMDFTRYDESEEHLSAIETIFTKELRNRWRESFQRAIGNSERDLELVDSWLSDDSLSWLALPYSAELDLLEHNLIDYFPYLASVVTDFISSNPECRTEILGYLLEYKETKRKIPSHDAGNDFLRILHQQISEYLSKRKFSISPYLLRSSRERYVNIFQLVSNMEDNPEVVDLLPDFPERILDHSDDIRSHVENLFARSNSTQVILVEEGNIRLERADAITVTSAEYMEIILYAVILSKSEWHKEFENLLKAALTLIGNDEIAYNLPIIVLDYCQSKITDRSDEGPTSALYNVSSRDLSSLFILSHIAAREDYKSLLPFFLNGFINLISSPVFYGFRDIPPFLIYGIHDVFILTRLYDFGVNSESMVSCKNVICKWRDRYSWSVTNQILDFCFVAFNRLESPQSSDVVDMINDFNSIFENVLQSDGCGVQLTIEYVLEMKEYAESYVNVIDVTKVVAALIGSGLFEPNDQKFLEIMNFFLKLDSGDKTFTFENQILLDALLKAVNYLSTKGEVFTYNIIISTSLIITLLFDIAVEEQRKDPQFDLEKLCENITKYVDVVLLLLCKMYIPLGIVASFVPVLMRSGEWLQEFSKKADVLVERGFERNDIMFGLSYIISLLSGYEIEFPADLKRLVNFVNGNDFVSIIGEWKDQYSSANTEDVASVFLQEFVFESDQQVTDLCVVIFTINKWRRKCDYYTIDKEILDLCLLELKAGGSQQVSDLKEVMLAFDSVFDEVLQGERGGVASVVRSLFKIGEDWRSHGNIVAVAKVVAVLVGRCGFATYDSELTRIMQFFLRLNSDNRFVLEHEPLLKAFLFAANYLQEKYGSHDLSSIITVVFDIVVMKQRVGLIADSEELNDVIIKYAEIIHILMKELNCSDHLLASQIACVLFNEPEWLKSFTSVVDVLCERHQLERHDIMSVLIYILSLPPVDDFLSSVSEEIMLGVNDQTIFSKFGDGKRFSLMRSAPLFPPSHRQVVERVDERDSDVVADDNKRALEVIPAENAVVVNAWISRLQLFLSAESQELQNLIMVLSVFNKWHRQYWSITAENILKLCLLDMGRYDAYRFPDLTRIVIDFDNFFEDICRRQRSSESADDKKRTLIESVIKAMLRIDESWRSGANLVAVLEVVFVLVVICKIEIDEIYFKPMMNFFLKLDEEGQRFISQNSTLFDAISIAANYLRSKSEFIDDREIASTIGSLFFIAFQQKKLDPECDFTELHDRVCQYVEFIYVLKQKFHFSDMMIAEVMPILLAEPDLLDALIEMQDDLSKDPSFNGLDKIRTAQYAVLLLPSELRTNMRHVVGVIKKIMQDDATEPSSVRYSFFGDDKQFAERLSDRLLSVDDGESLGAVDLSYT
ncbi:MAG: hypothetical protein JXR42_04110 [Gammaproteobacteria bacterium]|nr:hypothetical protein [Gammaproteobacteria bacterium]